MIGNALLIIGLAGFIWSIIGFNYGKHVDRKKFKEYIDNAEPNEDLLHNALTNDEILTDKGKLLNRWQWIVAIGSFILIIIGAQIAGYMG